MTLYGMLTDEGLVDCSAVQPGELYLTSAPTCTAAFANN